MDRFLQIFVRRFYFIGAILIILYGIGYFFGTVPHYHTLREWLELIRIYGEGWLGVTLLVASLEWLLERPWRHDRRKPN